MAAKVDASFKEQIDGFFFFKVKMLYGAFSAPVPGIKSVKHLDT